MWDRQLRCGENTGAACSLFDGALCNLRIYLLFLRKTYTLSL